MRFIGPIPKNAIMSRIVSSTKISRRHPTTKRLLVRFIDTKEESSLQTIRLRHPNWEYSKKHSTWRNEWCKTFSFIFHVQIVQSSMTKRNQKNKQQNIYIYIPIHTYKHKSKMLESHHERIRLRHNDTHKMVTEILGHKNAIPNFRNCRLMQINR